MATKVAKVAGAAIVNTDTLSWSNQYGGYLQVAANWMDVSTGAVAAAAPGIANAVSITGGASAFTNIIGTTAVAQLTVTNEVILWGTMTVGGPITVATDNIAGVTNFGLDGGAALTGASLNIQATSTLEVGGGSELAISGNTTLTAAYLSAMSGSTVILGGLIDGAGASNYSTNSTLAVDDNSSIEIGSAGAGAPGAVTIDKGQTIAFAGNVLGNIVVNGTVNVEGGRSLSIGTIADPSLAGLTVSGSGSIRLNEGSTLNLAAADSAAIQFTAPSGVLMLDEFGQTGTVSGFAATDIIETASGLATGVSAAATTSATRLTFTNGRSVVGILMLAGNYTGNLFHFSRNSSGYGTVTLQTIGSAPPVPALIVGTSGYDYLTATASNQTLSGLGGGDTISAAAFTGIDFKDTSNNLNGSIIQGFGTTDVIDLTDMSSAQASVAYTPGTGVALLPATSSPGSLMVTDGTHTATIMLPGLIAPQPGYFAITTDGGTGTDIRYRTVTADAYRFALPLGGSYSITGNWMDTTTGATATAPPGPGNSVTISGPSTGYTTVTGNGVAAGLTTSGNVMISGSISVPGLLNGSGGIAGLTQSGTLALVSGASLALGSGGALIGGSVNLGGASKLTAPGGVAFTAAGAALQVTGASSAQFATLNRPSSVSSNPPLAPASSSGYYAATIGVDATSSVEFGTVGGAQKGALTVDAGVTANFFGAINANVVLNGTLIEAGGSLAVGGFGSGNASITGAGTLAFGGANETLQLSGPDSAAIQFSTADILALGSILPTGTISGFGIGDTITVASGITALQYSSSGLKGGTLTLLNGSATVGTLTFAGTNVASQFLLQPGANGKPSTLAYQPGPIIGTPGFDILAATANNETLTGLGGNDLLEAGQFTGIDFKDTGINLNGSTIQAFGTTDVIDLTNVSSATATVVYTPRPGGSVSPSTVMITDGTHTASVTLSSPANLPVGYFATSSDGAGGTAVRYVTVNADAYSFSAPYGGSYSAAGNWTDATTGATASVPPGAGNNVTIAGGSAGYTDITGNGVAANLAISGDVLLWGSIAVSSIVGGTLVQSGTLTLDRGASLALPAGSSTVEALIGGTVELNGGSRLTASSLAFTRPGAGLQVTGGSTAAFSALDEAPAQSIAVPAAYYTATIGVDAISSIEVGTVGGAQKGALTVDAGVTANFFGAIDGNVVLNGTLIEAGSSLSIAGFGTSRGSITGGGTLAFGGSSQTLQLTGADSAAIQFAGANDVLALGTILPTGIISGFAAGDTITLAEAVTSLRYSRKTTSGTLTLLNGSTTVGVLTLAGSYNANQFQLQLPTNGQSISIGYLQTPGTTLGNQVSLNSHAYNWTAAAGGDWTNPANWSDAGTVPTAAPGSNNAVTVSNFGALGELISGSGSAASLTANLSPSASPGSLVFTGAINVTGLFTTNAYSGYVTIGNGANFTVGALDQNGGLQIGAGSLLQVTGVAGWTGQNGPVEVIGGSSLVAYAGGSVEGNLSVDRSSTVEFGSLGDPTAGALTIDAGTVTGFDNGTIAANVIVSGTVDVNHTTIEGFAGTVGTVSGSGTLSLIYGAHLTLNAVDSVAIAFDPYQPFQSLGTLEIVGPLPTGAIIGFVAGNIVQVDQTVTGLSYAQTTQTQGTLTLFNGAARIGTLKLTGSYLADMFHVDVAAATGYASISVLAQPNSGGTALPGTNKDAYSWAPASTKGGWSTASCWTDTTTKTTPQTAPGTGNAVTIAGSGPIAIGGNGTAGSLTDVTASLLLTGRINIAGRLTVNAPSGPTAVLALDAGAQLTAATAVISGQLEAGGGSSATVTGTASVSNGTLLALTGSKLQFGSLAGNNDIVAVDANSAIVVGQVASVVPGALNLATGSSVALTGVIYGNVVANGLLSVAAGGALSIDLSGNAEYDPYETNPAITGSGTLSLAENSTLSLGVTDSAAIQFAGPNAALVVAALPNGIISGFAASDQIEVALPVTGLAYAQTSANAATLTLTNGTATVGTLKLAGNYSSGANVFHLEATSGGSIAAITLQSLGLAPAQPTLIQGTTAADILAATANGQTLTSLGGGDSLNGAGFTGITSRI